MPEGDTIYKLADYLAPRLVERRVAEGIARLPAATPLGGLRVEAVQALGKHLMIAFDDGRILRSHLGMWGSWHRYGPGEPWRRPAREARIELAVDGQLYVCFKPKEVELLRDRGLRHRLLAARLGPDLIQGNADEAVILQRAREIHERDAPLLDLLLDQRVAAGIGNVYKSEVLFLERRHPLTPAGELDDVDLIELYRRARTLLRANLGGGPRVTRPKGQNADRDRLWVYGRRGLACFGCSTPIEAGRLGTAQRSTYWCPDCQPRGRGTLC